MSRRRRPSSSVGLALAAAVAAAAPGTAQVDYAAVVDPVFAEWDRADSPGCAVGIVRDGQLVYTRGYGEANLDYGIPNGPNIVYYSGSVSKQFTAAAIALLVQDGVLSLDDDVRRWFPELPVYERPITVRHLVHHTSGLRDIYVLMDLAGIRLEDVFSDEEAIALIARQRELNFTPGADHLYSNSGYFLLGQLVERATGRSLREFTTERIFEPLDMTHTHFHDRPWEIVENRAISYQPDDDGGFRISYLGNFDKVGAGGLYTTIEDLAKWDAQFYSPRIGGQAFLDRVHTRGVLTGGDTIAYAFGLTMGARRGVRTVRHSGSMMGFKADLTRFPDERMTVLSLCNLGTIEPGALANRIADALLADRMAPEPERAGSAPGAARRTEGAPPDAVLAAALTGEYRSDELDVVYRIAQRDGALVLERPGAGARPIRSRQADGLVAGTLTLHPARDPGGAVTGFTIDAGRVRNIRFERVVVTPPRTPG